MENTGFKLDTEQIEKYLIEQDRTQSWLAKKINRGRQWVYNDLNSGCLARVKLYADVLGVDPKDLIK